MKKYFFTFLTLIIFNFSLISQEKIDGHLKAINDYIASYNSQDFGKMRKNFSSVLKLVFTEKRLEQLYGYQYKLLGKAKIDKIEKRTEKSYFIDLKYALDTTEVQKIGLTLTEKNKIIGLFNPNFKFIYSKQENTNELNNQKVFTKLDSLVELKHKVANFNGCITVIKDKNEYYKNCKGDLKIDNQESLNENTLFDLASCSKPFTAMSIMILQEQGKLNYSDNIEKFLPDFPYKDITIENLLTHTSGLPDYMELFEKNWDKSKIATNKDVLELLMKYKPKMSFKPGKQYEYCNTGYAVLSSIIEKISGQSFKDFMSDSIFKPLGMNRTQVYNSRYTNIEILKNRASGHSYSDDLKKYTEVSKLPELDYYRYLDGINGDGAINSSISELALWDNGLRENRIVRKETFENAIKPFKLSKGEISQYGYGWELQIDEKFERVIYHSGSWGGYTSFILHFIDKDLTVIILSNNEYINIAKFAYKVAEIVRK